MIGLLPLSLLLAATAPSADGGTPTTEPDPEPTLTTVVTSTRVESDPMEQPRAVTVLRAEDLARRGARTTPEALLESEGVFLQRTNPGGGAPILRGLLGQHILLLVDGVRLNNATVRSGPNQFLNTVDPFTVEQLEVVRGPGSVLYGSDALGGVVSVRTFQPRFSSEPTPTLLLRGQGGTADTSLQGNLRAGVSLRDTAVAAAITGRDFNDLTGGGQVGLQHYTAYEEADATVKLRQRLAFGSELQLQYQGVRQSNAPRLDRSTPGDFRRFSDQERDLGHLRLVSRGAGMFRQLSLDLSLHRQADVTDRFRISRDRIESDTATVWTWGLRAEGTLPVELWGLGQGDLVMGGDAYFDRVLSGFTRLSISDPAAAQVRPQDARYPGAPTALSGGLFAVLSTDAKRPLSYHAGLRVQANSTRLPEDSRLRELFATAAEPPPVFPATTVLTTGVAAEAGVRGNLPWGLQALVNLGTGFRAPNVDDFLRLGAEGPGFVVPTRELHPEQSFTAEGGLRWVHAQARVQAFYSFTTLPGLIGNAPTAVDGQILTPDGLPYLIRQNRDQASIHSVELSAQVQPVATLRLGGHLGWTLGTQVLRDLTDPAQPLIHEPLSRLPPLNGTATVTYEPWSFLFLEGVVRGASAQTRLSGSDRLDLRICAEAPGCTGTPEFMVLHARVGTRWKNLSGSLSFQNLTDATYRTHGSGVDEAGRSVVLSVEGRL
ncbi:MAG: TonB-dependent receptor [Myxococcota bacterium]|nr:TonB-dependent receptor [Myxococcota bacterium]